VYLTPEITGRGRPWDTSSAGGTPASPHPGADRIPPDPRPGPEGPGPVHRTYRIPEELRAAVLARRTALGQTVRAFVAGAVARELPALVEALAALGLSRPAAAGLRPIRLPLTHGPARVPEGGRGPERGPGQPPAAGLPRQDPPAAGGAAGSRVEIGA
jgi:hypothetical protein